MKRTADGHRVFSRDFKIAAVRRVLAGEELKKVARDLGSSTPLRSCWASGLFGICLGYEDLNDHDQLRSDPMLAVAVRKADPLGLNRLREEDRGKALAGKSTLNRLELAKSGEIDKYKKILMKEHEIDTWIVKAFIDAHGAAPDEIVLDLDATDDPIH